MKMTFNRQLILSVLSENIDGSPPPHSAGTIGYSLENAFNCTWNVEPYASMKTLPNKRQIHRTLKELWQGGFIVGSRVKIEGYNGQLPYWEIEYQLSNEVYKNTLIAECNAIYRKVDKAKNGSRFFSSVFDMGLPASEVKPLMLRVKGLMQKTHPDKANGYEDQFKQMMECAAWIRSGIPLPTPTHEAGEKVTLKLTYPK
ncbi:MAG: hypothetical protein ACXWTS_02350 [Methylococcaceae bacterium]